MCYCTGIGFDSTKEKKIQTILLSALVKSEIGKSKKKKVRYFFFDDTLGNDIIVLCKPAELPEKVGGSLKTNERKGMQKKPYRKRKGIGGIGESNPGPLAIFISEF